MTCSLAGSTAEDFLMEFTDEQKEECKRYLNYCVKEGALDVEDAEKIVKDENWKKVYGMMDYAENQRDVARDEGGEAR